ncbi:MAG: MurR/RpiR family transcriptional regulator [Roseovarius sp.]|nr:MurR/RpiR family transcriptional regulator [Roseovarius sp.]
MARNFDGLSDRLRQAAEYVAAHPVDIATRSLRAVAQESGLAPASFSRLARALDYRSFEALREAMRAKIDRRVNSFAERAERLQAAHEAGESSFCEAHVSACLRNLQTLLRDMDMALLDRTVERLHAARNVVLVGALGSTGIVEYLSYMANFCSGNWSMAGRMGASLGSALTGMDGRDAMVIVTKPPYSTRSVEAAHMAAAQGAFVVVITDSPACPALPSASAGFVVPTDSPHFYSSYVATTALVEIVVGMLVGRAGAAARARIAQVEQNSRRLGEVWDV